MISHCYRHKKRLHTQKVSCCHQATSVNGITMCLYFLPPPSACHQSVLCVAVLCSKPRQPCKHTTAPEPAREMWATLSSLALSRALLTKTHVATQHLQYPPSSTLIPPTPTRLVNRKEELCTFIAPNSCRTWSQETWHHLPEPLNGFDTRMTSS